MFLNNVSVRMRLFVSYILLILLTLTSGLLGIKGMWDLYHNMEYLGSDRIPDLIHLDELNFQRMVIRAQTLEVFAAPESISPSQEMTRILTARNNSPPGTKRQCPFVNRQRRTGKTTERSATNQSNTA